MKKRIHITVSDFTYKEIENIIIKEKIVNKSALVENLILEGLKKRR